MSDANTKQHGGDHYKKDVLQHWDLAAIYNWDYFQARAIAYLMRWREKGGIEDLEKAGHFVQKYIEIEKLRKQGGETAVTQVLLQSALSKAVGGETQNQEPPRQPDTWNVQGLPNTPPPRHKELDDDARHRRSD